MEPILPDTKIRYTRGPLGVLDPESSRPAMHPDVQVAKGDIGSYVGPERNVCAGEWHLTRIERDGVSYLVPVHDAMFEVV